MRSTPSGIKLAAADETMVTSSYDSRAGVAAARSRDDRCRGSASRLRDKTDAGSPQSGSPSRYRGLRPDLLGVHADLERFGIGTRELVHRGLEFCALSIGITGDRPADAVELDREGRIAQRFASDV